MVAGLLRVLIKVLAVAAVAALLLTIVGDYLRQLVPGQYHRAIWLAGLLISLPCALAAVLTQRLGLAVLRRFENLLLVGVVVGTLLFLLFVTEVDCTLTQSMHGRLSLSCRYSEEP